MSKTAYSTAREQTSNGIKGIGNTKDGKLIITTEMDEEILDQTLIDNIEANNYMSSPKRGSAGKPRLRP